MGHIQNTGIKTIRSKVVMSYQEALLWIRDKVKLCWLPGNNNLEDHRKDFGKTRHQNIERRRGTLHKTSDIVVAGYHSRNIRNNITRDGANGMITYINSRQQKWGITTNCFCNEDDDLLCFCLRTYRKQKASTG